MTQWWVYFNCPSHSLLKVITNSASSHVDVGLSCFFLSILMADGSSAAMVGPDNYAVPGGTVRLAVERFVFAPLCKHDTLVASFG